MGFIMEFAENLIRKIMEDPKERDRRQREYLYSLQDHCKRNRENWNLPVRPYGFWNFEKHNLSLYWDMEISQAPGRTGPYDNISVDPFDVAKKK